MRREEADPQRDPIGTEDLVAAGDPDTRDTLAEDQADSVTDSPHGSRDGEQHTRHPDTFTGTDGRDDMPRTGRDTAGERVTDHTPLLGESDSERFRSRWHDVQAGFVDDPQRAVRDADQLVAELMQTLATTFAERKQSLEGQWQQATDAETENLRLALRSYHSFFDQLLPH